MNLQAIGKDLFNKIRGRFPGVTIGDSTGKITNKPEDARFFDFEFKEGGNVLGKVSISISEEDGLVVLHNKDMVEGAPTTVKEGVSKDEAEELKKQLEEAGATVELK